MTKPGTLTLTAAVIVLSFAGCKAKDGDKSDPTATPASQAPAPPPPPATATAPATPTPADPNALNETCKKNFATTCALPCEQKAQTTIKDPVRLKTALNQCMVACLEQAEHACAKH